MDVILSTFAERRLATLGAGEVALYDALLSENDHDLFRWVSGRDPAPDRFRPLVAEIGAEMARSRAARHV